MKADKYSIREFFSNRNLEQIIVPEIQRDYVWREEQINGLLNSISYDFRNYLKNNTSDLASKDPAYIEYYKKNFLSSNIGFIYAYNDEQYPDRYFLIDGQQRLTTIILTLLVLAKRNEALRDRFRRTFYNNEITKLDYKVRETSHDFLNRFIPFMLDGNSEITIQKWYYAEYKQDTTINSLLRNAVLINEYFAKETIDEEGFYRFVEDYTDLRYFDTNLSEQGEELYIYMNARGEQTQSHENIKADLLSKIDKNSEEKDKYGRLWEEWQDFFWIHRGNNENADNGFNEFLACISGLENYLKGEKGYFYSKEQFDNQKNIRTDQILKTIDFDVLTKYISALEYLENYKTDFQKKYSYSEWVEKCLREIWELFNDKKTNWYADYDDDNRATEKNRMVFLWSILIYITKAIANQKSVDDIFRALRVYYLKYHNFIRSVGKITKHTENLIINNFEYDDDKENTEEFFKANLLSHFNGNSLLRAEELIWEIEDHKFNLDGSDVGGTNIGYILSINVYSIDYIEKVKNKFYEVFPPDQIKYLIVQNILLYYSMYWYRVSPYYYRNYKFDDWRRVIRNIGNSKEDIRTAFFDFFNDFMNFEGNIQEFLEKLRSNIVDAEISSNLREKLLWYNQHLGDNMWQVGNYIALSIGNPCNLSDWKGKDKAFANDYIFYNTKGNLKGGNPQKLFKLLPNDIKKQIKEDKPIDNDAN